MQWNYCANLHKGYKVDRTHSMGAATNHKPCPGNHWTRHERHVGEVAVVEEVESLPFEHHRQTRSSGFER